MTESGERPFQPVDNINHGYMMNGQEVKSPAAPSTTGEAPAFQPVDNINHGYMMNGQEVKSPTAPSVSTTSETR